MPREAEKRVTIYDIARRTGVSSATVARVLKGDLKPTWKSTAQRAEHIRKVAESMGYRPDHRARAFATGRSQCIGLLYERTTVYTESISLLSNVAEACQRRNHDLMLIPALGPAEQWASRVQGHRVDGCLVTTPMPQSLDLLITERGVPLVLMNMQTELPVPQVMVDDRDGAHQAVAHLVQLGHRRIGYFTRLKDARSSQHYSTAARLAGYREAMATAGLAGCIQEFERPVDDFADWLQRTPASQRPTGLVCYADGEAQTLASRLWERGMRLPGDLSLVGFNDDIWASRSVPPLTSVGLPWAQLADLSADLLVRQIEGETDIPRRSVLRETLVVRASTAKPRD